MSKAEYKYLNIKGTVLDNYQLQNYMEQIASNHEVKAKSDKWTYPIPRLKDNFRFIEKTYNLLNEHVKMGIDIHSAGEWLLDNFYIIEETYKTVASEMNLKKYKSFPGISAGIYKGYSRIYVLASEIVAYTDNKINDDILSKAILSYQKRKLLSMEEIWNLWVFLEIALIENIRYICEKIYLAQMQKYKVEDIIERLVERKENRNQIFKSLKSNNKNSKVYKEMRYTFIEYMSYKLKKYGKQGLPYLEILEEQVNKMGMTISEAIQKEHYDIAISKVSIGNSIMSLKEILRVNFSSLFEKINGSEEILKKDPANVYTKMDYKTKEYYRNEIKNISEQSQVSEIYIANKIVELAKKFKGERRKEDRKKSHIGYYLMSKGRNELLNLLGVKTKRYVSNEKKAKRYIFGAGFLSIILSVLIGSYFYFAYKNIVVSIITGVVLFVPVSEIVIQLVNYILNKNVKPSLIPKLDFMQGVPKEYSTFVVIPTIINSKEKVKELMKKLEVYYLANKSDNLYFALLGDCTSGKNENEDFDDEIISAGIKEAEELNKKYSKNFDEDFPKFNFLYRKRTWNPSEKCYLGWERKRGLLCEFNEFLINGTDHFRANSIVGAGDPQNKIKYVITLDADTNLVLESATQLIGSMAHILNEPVLSKNKDVVIDGHGIIQPRIGIDLEASRKSLFTKIYAGLGGTDLYANAISDIYQDNFDEGIFTGKGIYDLEIFHKVLSNQIPDNTVLSHDLLEGSYLRCGLATDILLIDGTPSKYNSYLQRESRWIRGDWQILSWLGGKVKLKNGTKKINPLNTLSKFKILDNLRRSLLPVSILLGLIISVFLKLFTDISTWQIVTICLVAYSFSPILDIINYIIFKKGKDSRFIYAHRSIAKNISSIKASILRGILEIAFLPHKICMSLKSIIKTIYRMKVSKMNLLEWLTAEEAEKKAGIDLVSYYKLMNANIVFGILFLVFGIFTGQIIAIIGASLWLLGPVLAWHISKDINKKKAVESVSKNDREYILEIGKKTWQYFKDNINEENNFLPPDNYQEGRKNKIAHRTSSTNIGLGMMAIISAYDLKYIEIDESLSLLSKMLETIVKLQKWNGHLYNWYDTKTLEPLIPRYISTVDNGNFIGYLYTTKQFLINIVGAESISARTGNFDNIPQMIKTIENIIENTDFEILYNPKKRLFSIGFDVEQNKLTNSYYDLLASEARQASLIAIAKKDVPSKHWNALSRTLTSLNKYKGLISWSGTAFEYLMPNINIGQYEGSLLDESCRFLIMSQREYARRLGIPWGISESAFNLKDLNNNYQYKSFGVPWLGLKRGLEDDMVVSPYAVLLSLNYVPKEAVENLKELEKENMLGNYGFYEAIDYTISRLKYGKKCETVKTYMAHHQGLSLLSINNFINNNILIKRFMDNPEIKAVDILLQERMPEKAIITKEKKEKPEKVKPKDYENYFEKTYTKIENKLNVTNTISNGTYTVCVKQNGEGFSKYKGILINRFKETADYNQGILFYIKDVANKRIWVNTPVDETNRGDKYNIAFAPERHKFVRTDGDIETTTKVIVSPDDPVEIRRLELKNNGVQERTLEVTNYFEPVLSGPMQDYAHMAFNNLFLTFEELENESILVKRKKRGENQKDLYLGALFYTEHETIGEFEFEIDKEKFLGKKKELIPEMVKDSKPYSRNIGLVTDPGLAMKRTIKIEPKETVILDFVVCVSRDKDVISSLLDKYRNTKMVTKTLELARAKVEAESIYLGLKGTDIEKYQKLLSYVIFNNPLKKLTLANLPKEIYSQSNLWKYGISGDLPIILVKIEDLNDMYVVQDILKAHEFFRSKDIRCDVVILNNEQNSYDQYVNYEIENAILNKQIEYLKNISGGIFVINKNQIEKEDIELLEFKANVIINAKYGDIITQINDLEEEYLKELKNVGLDVKPEYIFQNEKSSIQSIDMSNLKYYNEYGGFSEDGSEYIIKLDKENKLPTVWSMVLANETFGTVVTQNLGGFTWHKNSRLNRLSAWNNNPASDLPSEIIYLKDYKTGEKWSLSDNINSRDGESYITYGFGYVKLKSSVNNILQELEVFVPKNDNIKINILKLKNLEPSKRKLKLVYYIKPVLGEDEIKTNGYIEVKKDGNVVTARNLYKDDFKNGISFISSSEKIKSYTGSKDFFIGTGDLKNPEALDKVSLDDTSGLGQNSCIAFEIEIELESFENKEIVLQFGEEDNLLDVKNIAYKYSKISNCVQELNKVKAFWYELLNRVEVKTPLESLNIMINSWVKYQTITSRLWAKSGYYQSGGAIGFRDQLQDTIGLKYTDISYMKNQILIACKHQFIEGDVEHWWHEETKRGIRTRFSDDLLWLCYVAYEYISYTGDYSILDIEEPYVVGEPLPDGIDERYDIYLESETKEEVYSHLIRAIDRSLNFGENGLPKIGSGDWNDGLNTVGNKHKGESIWLGFFLYDILTKFIPICEKRNDLERVGLYKEKKEALKKALNTAGWDGRWFRRAYMDSGEPLRKYGKRRMQNRQYISKLGSNIKCSR